jgi:SAM-dependent methyltransferase
VQKLGFESPQAIAFELIEPASRVLDLGCAGGALAAELRERKGCYVVGVDLFPLAPGVELDEFVVHDLDQPDLPVSVDDFDYVLMLDVIEHLSDPESFLERLRVAAALSPDLTLVVSTGNVAFLLTRMLLFAGQFNYGKRGILDLTHTRLFTFASFRRLVDGAGFEILEQRGMPAPIQLAFGSRPLGKALFACGKLATRLRGEIFAYQCFIVAKPRPSLAYLLSRAQEASVVRSAEPRESRPAP